MSTDRVLGNYLGIVVQNNDPEKRGRVKVFIPLLSSTLFEDWNKDKIDKEFTFLDKDSNPDLDKILPTIKDTLSWAEVALPMFGGSASGRYNAILRKGTTSDSNYWDGNTLVEGFRPLQNYVGENRVTDAFTKAVEGETVSRFVNPHSGTYSPSDYSNLARGLFTPLNVGAHVWVFFEGGIPTSPVVFAISQGLHDWRRIFTGSKDTNDSSFVSVDHPESYENLDSNGVLNHDTKTFRSKHVFNSNKHSLEFIDTDLREILKMTHYSGSFLEFNNSTTSRFATNNDQLLVLGDQFLTVRRNQANFIANYQENTILGDRITNIGDFVKKKATATQILNILRDTHDYKRVFEVLRTDSNYPHTSRLQTKSGEPNDCPVCGGSGDKFGLPCITCGGSGVSPSSQDGDYEVKDNTEVKDKIKENQQKLIDRDLEAQFGNGGDDIVLITGNRVVTIGTIFNDMESYRIDPVGKIRDAGTYIGMSGTYTAMKEVPLVEYVDVDSVPGGDYSVTVGNKYTLNVGSKGIHIKTTGPLDIYGTIVNLTGESVNISSDWEVLIDGGKRVEIRGDVINLKPHKGSRQYVNVDGNLGVNANLTVVGGAFVEGELSYLHQTAPMETYLTEIGYGPLPHVHAFFAPPWTLVPTCEGVRTASGGVNAATPAQNMKCPGFWIPG